MPEQPSSPNPTPASSSDSPLPMGPGAAFTFFYYFSGTALITTLLVARSMGVGLATGLPGQVGILVGLVGGALGAYFNRANTLELPTSGPKRGMKKLEQVLTEMGYSLSETEGNVSLYQRSPLSRLFSGDIYVQQQNNKVVLLSRANNIRKLNRRLNQSLN